MKVQKNDRGFIIIEHPSYPKEEMKRLLQESSIIGDYEDAYTNPGSSALWIGEDFHLNREEVYQLIVILRMWLNTKRLPAKIMLIS